MSKKSGRRTKRRRPPAQAAQDKRPAAKTPDPLPAQLEAFLLVYDTNGGNGTRAWLESHPEVVSIHAAAVESSKALRKPNIRARLEELRAARFKRLHMSADEAIGRISLDAQADPRKLYDEAGKMLPPHLWPDDVAQSIRSIRPGPFGDAITLNDSLAARRIVLEHAGKLDGPTKAVLTLAKLIAGDFDEEEETP